jgi:hypothetical protein
VGATGEGEGEEGEEEEDNPLGYVCLKFIKV